MTEEVTDIKTEAATEQPKDADSLLNTADKGGSDAANSTQGVWPEDWRERLANGDEKVLGQLKRMSSIEGVWNKARSLEQKLSSGEYKRTLAENATPEQIAEWRKDHDIPEDVKGYEIPKIAGHEWSEEDQPMIEGFLGAMHAQNAPRGVAQAALGWYAKAQQEIATKQYEGDTQARDKTEDALRAEWGGEYRGNIALVKRFLEKDMPHGAEIAYARLPNGQRLIETPEFVKWVANLSREAYGDGGILTESAQTANASRKAEIEKIMREDLGRYYSEGLDKELSQIYQREHAAEMRRAS